MRDAFDCMSGVAGSDDRGHDSADPIVSEWTNIIVNNQNSNFAFHKW